MKSVLMSIHERHNRNIESGKKTSELRTRPPKLKTPFKVYTYESGFYGRHKVVNEWICKDITTWRICMGVPAHLPLKACVSVEEIREYSGKDYKDIAEMRISNLKIYDKPKELGEFKKQCHKRKCGECIYADWDYEVDIDEEELYCIADKKLSVTRPPQSWCYIEDMNE